MAPLAFDEKPTDEGRVVEIFEASIWVEVTFKEHSSFRSMSMEEKRQYIGAKWTGYLGLEAFILLFEKMSFDCNC